MVGKCVHAAIFVWSENTFCAISSPLNGVYFTPFCLYHVGCGKVGIFVLLVDFGGVEGNVALVFIAKTGK